MRVCGLAAVTALFARDPARVERLFFTPALAAALGEPCRVLAAARKPFRAVEATELARIAGTVLHGGVVAIARPLPVLDFDPRAVASWAESPSPLLILDGIGNPHNLGAIARSAAFFGVERLLLADRPEQALPSDASHRVAEGGLEALSLHRVRLPEALHRLKPAYRVLGTAPSGGAPPPQRRGGQPLALVLGNEENGLAPATLAACDRVVTLAGEGGMQSLNVAAFAAILLYALTRL